MRVPALVLLALSTAAAGCGYTLRAGIGPTLDSDGHPGLMARLEAGVAFAVTQDYSVQETAGLAGGAGIGYGDEDPPLAAGVLVGLDMVRLPDDPEHGFRFGPTFRVEGPNEGTEGGDGEEDESATYGIGGRVAMLKELGSRSGSKRWSGSDHEKGGFGFDLKWRTVSALALEVSGEVLWNDPRGERVRFGLLIGYERTGLLLP